MGLITRRILGYRRNLSRLRLVLTRLSLPMVLMIAFLPAPKFLSTNSLLSSDNPNRMVEKTITIMTSHWQLVNWSDGESVCDLYLKHDQWPDYSDVATSCGADVWVDWYSTPACESVQSGQDYAGCKGLFLRYIDQAPKDYVEEVELPGIGFTVKSYNCAPGEWCDARPVLEIIASEPVSGYQITQVHLRVGLYEKVFEGDYGLFTLPITNQDGSWLEYWADSTFGDRSLPVRLMYRNLMSTDGASFHFDLLDSQWSDSLPPGSLDWGIFSPADDSLPDSLVQPLDAAGLNTSDDYHYLSGYLIQSGQVDASSCSDGGLYTVGSSSPCGDLAARNLTIAWQNKYDPQILQSAQKYNVPAKILKGIISQESQFWPETGSPYEKGLGSITESGIELLLNWNIPFYLEICQPLYGEGICSYGYSSLKEPRQFLLRKTVWDLIGTPAEIDVLAAMLKASAEQSGQLVQNISGQEIIYVASYTDMWKITIGNYNAGAGCIGDSLNQVVENDESITWDAVVSHLSSICSPSEAYVRQVMDLSTTSQ
jgi:hypothetical protein